MIEKENVSSWLREHGNKASDTRFLHVGLKTGKAKLSGRPGPKTRTIDIAVQGLNHAYFDPLMVRIIDDVLTPTVRAAEDPDSEGHVHYCLAPPDPWLTAVGMVMWEGIIQGLAWDMVKPIVGTLLTNLRSLGMAPDPKADQGSKSSLTLGFSWIQYTEGKKQREMFFGLKRSFEREARRNAATVEKRHRAKPKRRKK